MTSAPSLPPLSSGSRWSSLAPGLLVLLLLGAGAAAAQPVLPEAEEAFAEALASFEAEEFAAAFEGFNHVIVGFAQHRKTDAAMLMAAKALYRTGDYAATADMLTAFLDQYSESSYRDAAERTRQHAQSQQAKHAREQSAIRIGIALPLNEKDFALTQALYRGIEIAVEEHNARNERLVRMLFQDTRNSEDGAREAVAHLVREDVDVIVGPLYSAEALAAARMADQEGVVMVAPLATDTDIARGRRHVFQANPPIAHRGAFMARVAVDRLAIETVGVIAQMGNAAGEEMAAAFHDEALRMGAEVVFHESLDSARDWADLPDTIESLDSVDAVYLPVQASGGDDTRRLILQTLGRLSPAPHILGGTAWNNQAFSQYARSLKVPVTFADVFYVNHNLPTIRSFKVRYQKKSGDADPSRLAYVGYDVAQYLLSHLQREEGSPLARRLQASEMYEGLGTRIKFDRDHANEALFLLTYDIGGVRVVR